jgi:hypothetical protein
MASHPNTVKSARPSERSSTASVSSVAPTAPSARSWGSATARRDPVEPIAEQVDRPGQRVRGLCREEIDDRLGRVRQAGAGPLRAHVGGDGPGRFLGDGPRGVRDRVEEASAALDALGEDERMQATTAVEHRSLEPVAVAHPRVLEVERGRQWGNRLRERLLPTPQEPRAERGREAIPAVAIRDRRHWLPLVTRCEHRAEPGLGPPLGQHRRALSRRLGRTAGRHLAGQQLPQEGDGSGGVGSEILGACLDADAAAVRDCP